MHCEVRFSPTPALSELGGFSSWFFPDGGDSLDAWATGLTTTPAWSIVAAHTPNGIVVAVEDAC
ncbi:hypothetical protein [Streptodolium elevatio]|uniref:Uncharacterized protein n=1 Tax=Streptodolium elevatio TaxID=3157996 RepID=A0ABV3DEA9_9ACTN